MESWERENRIQLSIESAEVCGNVGIWFISYWKEVFECYSLLQHCVYIKLHVVFYEQTDSYKKRDKGEKSFHIYVIPLISHL